MQTDRLKDFHLSRVIALILGMAQSQLTVRVASPALDVVIGKADGSETASRCECLDGRAAREAGTLRFWQSVATSADGSQMVAVVLGGRICISGDHGVTWTAREQERDWVSVASAADGKRLVASTFGGKLYSSANFGIRWTEREATRSWYPLATSADGMRVIATVPGESLYTSNLEPLPRAPRTSFGTPGSVEGERYDAIELHYNGGGSFIVLDASGTFEVQ